MSRFLMVHCVYKPQHWDWGQTDITSPIFTLCSVIDYCNKQFSGNSLNMGWMYCMNFAKETSF